MSKTTTRTGGIEGQPLAKSSYLSAVSEATGGRVGADGQGNGKCPRCDAPKFRYREGRDDGLLTYSCQSGKCQAPSFAGDLDWLGEVKGLLIAAGVPTKCFRATGGSKPSPSRSSADVATASANPEPGPVLPTDKALEQRQDDLFASDLHLRRLRERVGLSAEHVATAEIGYDRESRRYWLPVLDSDTGELLTIIRRDFRPNIARGRKSWIWKGSRGAYLYAPFGVRDDEPVIVAAGERDCLALCALDFNAVCFTNGEGTTPAPERIRPLSGKHLVFMYDNDEGNKSKAVASGVLPHVGSTSIVEWEGIPDGYDVWDILSDKELGLDVIHKALLNAKPWGAAEARIEEEDADFQKALSRARLNDRVKGHLAIERADAIFVVPPSDLSLVEMLAKEREPQKFTIDQLHPEGSNAVIAAQYKVGKTTLMMNLAKAYADGDKFLGNFAVNPGGGRVALFNYELTEDMILDHYLIPLGIENPDRVVVLNLRGMNFDLRSKSAFDWAVKWLRERGCDALIVDPFGAAARLQNENDNSEARNWLLGTLDPFKEAAGIRDVWMPAHTGRAEKEEGAEHVRGASSVDDWADVRWLYSKAKVADEDGQNIMRRFLSADGRGVDVSEREVQFDKEDHSLFVSDFRSRSQVRSEGSSIQAVRVVQATPGLKAGELQSAMKGDTAVIKAGIRTAVQKGWIAVTPGPNNSKFHSVTNAGFAAMGQL
jgi:AAA domain